jgi:putative DNA primase/helicase
MDANHYLLNVENGTLDLRTNTFMDHNSTDYLTKLAPVTFDSQAMCPKWIAFVNKVFCNNQELIAFVQRLAGYSLAGVVSEHLLAICHGGGANGKTTFAETLRRLMGDYAQQTPSEMLLARNNRGSATPDEARLRGARFVVATELPEGRRLDENRVKTLTGGDTIVARRLYGDYFEFRPSHTLWAMTNYRPIIVGQDEGIWRRVLLVPFDYVFPVAERRAMGDVLEEFWEERSGILNWLLEGWRDYQQGGLRVPDIVWARSNDYREDMDELGAFLEECCTSGPDDWATHAELVQVYLEWARQNGIEPVGGRRLGQLLEDRGYTRIRAHGGVRGWRGVGLKLGVCISDEEKSR